MSSRSAKRKYEKEVAKQTTEEEAQMEERDALIEAGEYEISEVELLRLQKLMYQNNVAATDFNHLQEKLGEAQQKAMKAQGRFRKELQAVKKAHELEEWHDIKLDDEDGGVVYVDPRRKEEVEKQRKAKEEDKEEEAEQPETKEQASELKEA